MDAYVYTEVKWCRNFAISWPDQCEYWNDVAWFTNPIIYQPCDHKTFMW